MKKAIAIIISLVLLLTFTACNNNAHNTDSSSQPTNKNQSIDELKKVYPHFFNIEDDSLTVYVWQTSKNNHKCYLISTSQDAVSDHSFAFEVGTTIEEMKTILSTYTIDKKNIIIRTEVNPLSSYYYEIDENYRVKIKELFWNDNSKKTISTTVVKEGSDVDGVSINFKNIYIKDEKPYIEVEWKNATGNEFVYGESFELEYLNGRQFESCAKGDVYFNSLGYILPAESSKTEDYNLSKFDISKPGIYKFKVRYGESKYL